MQRDFQPCAYIMASQKQGRLYNGSTSNLMQRIAQHRAGSFDGHTNRYRIHRLVWFEMHDEMEGAISRERKLKKWNRRWKIELIEEENPKWRDLAVDLGFDPLPYQPIR